MWDERRGGTVMLNFYRLFLKAPQEAKTDAAEALRRVAPHFPEYGQEICEEWAADLDKDSPEPSQKELTEAARTILALALSVARGDAEGSWTLAWPYVKGRRSYILAGAAADRIAQMAEEIASLQGSTSEQWLQGRLRELAEGDPPDSG
jgi:hypothetical protein